jgi:hypothetical protein
VGSSESRPEPFDRPEPLDRALPLPVAQDACWASSAVPQSASTFISAERFGGSVITLESMVVCRLLDGPFIFCCGTLLRGGKALPMAEASLPMAKALRKPGELLLIIERGENELQRLGGGASRLLRRHADSSGSRRVGMSMAQSAQTPSCSATRLLHPLTSYSETKANGTTVLSRYGE